MFSPNFEMTFVNSLSTEFPEFKKSVFKSDSLLFNFFDKHRFVISIQNFWKFSFFATKSVSELISTITPLVSFIATLTNPSVAARPDFFCAVFIPFFLSHSSAFSKSPFISVRAALQSIIPAPVFSLSNLIFSGLIVIF